MTIDTRKAQGMGFEEALTATISARVARAEVERHGLEWADCVAALGDRPTYRGGAVLEWLGY